MGNIDYTRGVIGDIHYRREFQYYWPQEPMMFCPKCYGNRLDIRRTMDGKNYWVACGHACGYNGDATEHEPCSSREEAIEAWKRLPRDTGHKDTLLEFVAKLVDYASNSYETVSPEDFIKKYNNSGMAYRLMDSSEQEWNDFILSQSFTAKEE